MRIMGHPGVCRAAAKTSRQPNGDACVTGAAVTKFCRFLEVQRLVARSTAICCVQVSLRGEPS